MENLKDIQSHYVAEQAKIKDLKLKVDTRARQIVRLESRINKQQRAAWWGDLLIRPIMAAVKEKFPQLTWDDERLTPMGMRAAVSVFAHTGEVKAADCSNTVASITFTLAGFQDGQIRIDTGNTKNGEEFNYMADPNGFRNETILIESIEDVFAHVAKQIEEKI